MGLARTWSPYLQLREINVPRKSADRLARTLPRVVFLEFTVVLVESLLC